MAHAIEVEFCLRFLSPRAEFYLKRRLLIRSQTALAFTRWIQSSFSCQWNAPMRIPNRLKRKPEAPHCVERKQCLYVVCHTANSYFLNNKNCIVRNLKMYFLAVSQPCSQRKSKPRPLGTRLRPPDIFIFSHVTTCMLICSLIRLAMDHGESSGEWEQWVSDVDGSRVSSDYDGGDTIPCNWKEIYRGYKLSATCMRTTL